MGDGDVVHGDHGGGDSDRVRAECIGRVTVPPQLQASVIHGHAPPSPQWGPFPDALWLSTFSVKRVDCTFHFHTSGLPARLGSQVGLGQCGGGLRLWVHWRVSSEP